MIFARALERKPPKLIALRPEMFVDEWPEKPTEPLQAGLRLLSEREIELGRASAAQKAVELHEDADGRVEAYNDALMSYAVACALCEPQNSRAAYFESPHENVVLALTPEAIQALWEELETLHLELSPVIDEIEDDGIGALAEALADGAVQKLPDTRQGRMRRLLTYVLEELQRA